MTFVRLAGCNAPQLGLDCTEWCDTPESWDRAAGEPMGTGDILVRVHYPRLCLTGGEPLLQLGGVAELVAAAQTGGTRVHLETNGTVDPRPALFSTAPSLLSDLLAVEAAGLSDWDDDLPGGMGGVWATVSPKPPDYVIDPGWRGLVDELKLIADERLDAATAERLAAAFPEAIVSIQPQWENLSLGAPLGAQGGAAQRQNVERAVTLVMTHPGWRLSLQTHKFLGIR